MKIACLFICTLYPAFAQLKFDKLEHKIELDPKKESVSIRFPFITEANTEISNYFSHCGCLKAVTKKKAWTRGEQGEIELMLDTRQIMGTTRKSVEITCNDFPKQTLTVEAIMPPAITKHPKSHIWEKGSELEAKEYKILIHKDYEFTINELIASNKNFKVELIPDTLPDAQKGKKFTIKVTPPASQTREICMIKVKTTSDIKRYQSFNILALKK